MKVLFDVNVVIDVLQRRPDFFDNSYAVLRLAAEDQIEGYVAAGSIADIYYILRRAGLEPSEVRTALAQLIQIVELADTTAADVNEALLSPMADVEDAVLAACAKRLEATWIVTRNEDDFAASPVPAISPAQFLSRGLVA